MLTATPPTDAQTRRNRYRMAAVLAVLLREDYNPRVMEPRIIDDYLHGHPASLAAPNDLDD